MSKSCELCGQPDPGWGEIIIYQRAVSDEELLAIEGYLQTQWGCCPRRAVTVS